MITFGIRNVRDLVVHAQDQAKPITAEDLKKGVDDLKWALGLIVTAAGLFAIAQATAAWFSSQTFTKQAEDALERISEIQKDVESRFPMFSDYERLRNEAYNELEQNLRAASSSNKDEGYDWREDLYERMGLPNRQKLLSVERYIGIEFLRRPEDDITYIQNLQRLAHFYISKFKFEKSRNFGYLGDLERADYYLNLAYQRSENPFFLLNDLGLLNLQWYSNMHPSGKDLYLQQAEKFFKRSYSQNPNQQRAYYNLGVLESKRKDYSAAKSYAEMATRREVWEETAIEARTGDVYYNLACYYARLAVAERLNSSLVKSCFEALEKPANIGLVRKTTVDFDYDNKDGDFYPLLNSGDKPVVERLNNIRPLLSRNKNATRIREGKFRALAEAIKNLFRSST